MEQYILTYRKSSVITYEVHPSWYKLCESQTREAVIALLKKHGHAPGEYILHFYGYNDRILHKNNQNFFWGHVHQVNNLVPEGVKTVGFIHFDYYDDTFDVYDFKTCWPVIDCALEITNPTAKFSVCSDKISPSAIEFERICNTSWKRFVKTLHRSVTFPIIMECEFPDVIFEIHFKQSPTNKQREETLKLLTDFTVNYNKRHEEGIHHVAEADDYTLIGRENAVCIYIDFGNCNPEVLASALKCLGKSKLPIEEVILK